MDAEFAYNRALDYLYSFVDYSLKHASELAKADFNLDRMRDLLAALGDPQAKYPVLHVAGTKGKGSVCALSASALRAAGYRAGLYTSPHLQDYAERIQVDGRPIGHAELVELVEEIKPHVARIPMLTTFEITTALGFLYFARKQVDAAVIEVGLGGRLDATNVVAPLVSVITSLSYDHTAVLGSTLTAIAGEKAGIIKPGRPVVSAPQTDEALAVLTRVAAERGCPLTLVGRDIRYSPVRHSLEGQTLFVTDQRLSEAEGRAQRSPGAKSKPGMELKIPLLGAHQVENAAVAFAALRALGREGLKVTDAHIQKGFADVRWPGRFELLRRDPPVVLDSAHNRDSAVKLRQALDEYFPGKPVVLIFGSSEDKDVAGMLAEWAPRLRCVVATRADHPRALAPETLLGLAEQAGAGGEAVTPVSKALARALELAGEDALVLSAGSMFVTAEVRTAFQTLGTT